MKHLLLLLSIITFVDLYGQMDDLSKSSWPVGKEKILYNNKTTRIYGKNGFNGADVTNIGYQTLQQCLEFLDQKAKKEMWTDEKLATLKEGYKKNCAGGMIHMYITRLTIGAANTRWFTVIIRDSSDKNEIYRKELENDVPRPVSSYSSYWYNYTTVPIPEEVKGAFYVYVVDKLATENELPFKFYIEP